jgi:SAM-dependent methyltransferase
MMEFKDHFSSRAEGYSRYRPDYPAALIEYVAGLPAHRRVVWDCGTGGGQAAAALAAHFDRVIATDASAAQLAHARAHERVEYRVALAEESGLADESVDLVTVAQALHWFDRSRFFAEAHRVMAEDGAIAVWMYGNPAIDDRELDAVLLHFIDVTVDAYWPPERRLLLEGYSGIVFPFQELTPPRFVLEREWTLAEFCGYLRSWSAVSRYVAARGADPVDSLEAELSADWGDREIRRRISWPVVMRAGRK